MMLRISTSSLLVKRVPTAVVVTASSTSKTIVQLFLSTTSSSSTSAKTPPPPSAAVAKPAVAPKPVATAAAVASKEVAEISPITARREAMRKLDRHLVYQNEELEHKYLPGPVVPKNIKELTALDSSDRNFHHIREDGKKRTVQISQMESNYPKQSPLGSESMWRIYFYNDGSSTERWQNSLMGWTSNGDPYQSNPTLTFETAADAVYFAKKCGWNYTVSEPILRQVRTDTPQYQDNFLTPMVVARLRKEGIMTKEWERSYAASSHYFRPLNYHGTQPVPQYGPHGDTIPTAPHVTSMYKKR
jgi:ETC complex I subunit conserved region